MECPDCGHLNLPPDARYCPDCSQPVEIAARMDVRVDVESNSGRVIGVQTDTIQGDVYGGDIYQVQVYVLSEAGRQNNGQGFSGVLSSPYKFLSPYSPRDRLLFNGRQVETRRLVRLTGQQQLSILYGQSGVGKTSLLAAGVIPELAQYGALVVHVRDYSRPVETAIRSSLASYQEQLSVPLPEEADLAELVRAVREATQGTLVLVLDQFEQVFQPSYSPEERESLVTGLADSLVSTEPEYFRVILAVQEDYLVQLGELHDDLRRALSNSLHLMPLTPEQALEAILMPLGKPGDPIHFPVYFEEELVEKQLIPDLDDLTPLMPGYIHPPHLQIVCHWLYQAAVDQHPPIVTEKLYLVKNRGADGILARYLDETLQTRLAANREIAGEVMAWLASRTSEEWINFEQFPSNGASPDRMSDVLEQLVEAELLLKRPANGSSEYTFSSQVVAEEVRRMAGPGIEGSYQAGRELERIYSAWLAHEELAGARQLRRLSRLANQLEIPSLKALLLLRSAVANGEPTAPWLDRLRTDEGVALIRFLDSEAGLEQDRITSRGNIAKAELLLDLGAVGAAAEGNGHQRPYGRLAQAAVSHSDPVTRQVAALAITIPDRYKGLDHLSWALRDGLRGWPRLLRQSELRGALAEADPEMEKIEAGLSTLERIGIWAWRVRQRTGQDRERIAWYVRGGAVGAGLGLGLLRFLSAALNQQTVGLHGSMNFVFGALLGGAALWGHFISPHLLIKEKDPGRLQQLTPRKLLLAKGRTAWVAVLLGAFFFGIAHLLVALSIGDLSLRGKFLVVGMGFVAGLGLSLALAGLPGMYEASIPKAKSWLLRLGTASLFFTLAHLVFILTGETGRSITIIWPGRVYLAGLTRYGEMWGWRQLQSLPEWYNLVALLDAALVGLVLCAGILWGLQFSARLMKKWYISAPFD